MLYVEVFCAPIQLKKKPSFNTQQLSRPKCFAKSVVAKA